MTSETSPGYPLISIGLGGELPALGREPEAIIIPKQEREPQGRIKIIGFDKDGTLFNDMPDFPEIGAQEVSKHGVDYQYAYGYLHGVLGYPLPEHIAHLLTDPKTGKMLVNDETYESILSDIRVRLVDIPAVLFDDVIPTLTALKKYGYRMFVSSRHPEDIIRRQAERAGIAGFFETFIGETDLEKGEPHFRIAAERMGMDPNDFKSKLAYIGDSIPDAETTQRCTYLTQRGQELVRRKVTFIGRLGFAVPEAADFYEAGAFYVLKDLMNLPAILPIIS